MYICDIYMYICDACTKNVNSWFRNERIRSAVNSYVQSTIKFARLYEM